MSNLNIDSAIRLFAEFMNNSWNIVNPLLVERHYTTNEDSLSDWLQANWELLVERKILKIDEYLEPYGEGADFNAPSSRVTVPEALPTFSIKINPIIKEDIYDFLNEETCQVNDTEFIELVSFKRGFYIREPTFNYVLLRDSMDTERVVSIDHVRFEVNKITNYFPQG